MYLVHAACDVLWTRTARVAGALVPQFAHLKRSHGKALSDAHARAMGLCRLAAAVSTPQCAMCISRLAAALSTPPGGEVCGEVGAACGRRDFTLVASRGSLPSFQVQAAASMALSGLAVDWVWARRRGRLRRGSLSLTCALAPARLLRGCHSRQSPCCRWLPLWPRLVLRRRSKARLTYGRRCYSRPWPLPHWLLQPLVPPAVAAEQQATACGMERRAQGMDGIGPRARRAALPHRT